MTDLIAALVDQAPAICGALLVGFICVLGGRALSKRRG